jgi:Uncharacterized protein conserved in bacteria
MQMKQYLIETFRYNDYANKLALEKIRSLPEKDECIRFFSHLINSMNKWLGRIEKWGEEKPFPDLVLLPSRRRDAVTPPNQGEELNRPNYAEMDWWLPIYPLGELEARWDECLKIWVEFLDSKTEDELFKELEFTGFDGGNWAAVLNDIALQLNYHSIHHRAQIQYLIRQQGIEPDFVDYIGTKYRKLS